MNIVKAIHDPNLFRTYVCGSDDGSLESWRSWLAFLRVLYGLKTTESDRELVRESTGRDPDGMSKDGYSECLLLCGRRSGKSKVIALVAAAEAILSGREKNLSPGEIGMVAVVSPTRFQSRIVHSYLRGVFDSCPMLRNELVEEKRESFVLKNGVEVAILTGDPRTARGFSLLAVVVDEIAMHGLAEESKVRSDTELIRALRPSLATTGGPLLAIGTPYAASGYAYETFKRGYGNDDCDVLVWNAPSTVMNPTLSQAVVKRAIDEDPVAASVEFCVSRGLFREDVQHFITRQVVEGLVIKGRTELPPHSGIAYAAFADVSGGRSDDAALAIAHKEDRIVVLDCIERFKAPHDPHTVVAAMCATLRRYGCERALGDAYAAEWTRTTFAQHGILYNRASTSAWKEGAEAIQKIAKPKSVLYAELLPRLSSGEVELLDNDVLVSQLASLQRRTRSGGRDSIDHPPGGHDDVSNCLAGVCDAVHQRRAVAGAGGYGGSGGTPGQGPMQRALLADARRAEADQRSMEWQLRKYGSESYQAMINAMRKQSGPSPRLGR